MIQRLNPNQRWSDATICNGVAHFVEVPSDTSVDFDRQLTQLLESAEQTLEKIKADKGSLLYATIYLTDRVNVDALNNQWEAWLPFGSAPARACVLVELLDPKMLVEIAFVAATRSE